MSSSNVGNIKSVDQWGSIVWTNMKRAFRDVHNLNIAATDTPNLTQVADMGEMFF
jgi:hypothetical protein